MNDLSHLKEGDVVWVRGRVIDVSGPQEVFVELPECIGKWCISPNNLHDDPPPDEETDHTATDLRVDVEEHDRLIQAAFRRLDLVERKMLAIRKALG